MLWLNEVSAMDINCFDEQNFGNHGRLEIPDLNISVPLYDGGGGTSQSIVDKVNSAAYMHWINQDAISDHASQANFANLQNAQPGITKAFIVFPAQAEHYICVSNQIGHLKDMGEGKGRRVYDANWKCVYYENTGGLCIYTCRQMSADDVMDITLTYWQPV